MSDIRTFSKSKDDRQHFGKPVIINSGYRTPEHNAKVGGVKDTYYVKGMAAALVVRADTAGSLSLYMCNLQLSGSNLTLSAVNNVPTLLRL